MPYRMYAVELIVLLPCGIVWQTQLTQWFKDDGDIEAFKAFMLETHDIVDVWPFVSSLDSNKEKFDK